MGSLVEPSLGPRQKKMTKEAELTSSTSTQYSVFAFLLTSDLSPGARRLIQRCRCAPRLEEGRVQCDMVTTASRGRVDHLVALFRVSKCDTQQSEKPERRMVQ